MGVGKCKACESENVSTTYTSGGVSISCRDCGLMALGDTPQEAEEAWENIKVVYVGSERGRALTAMRLLSATSIAASLPLIPEFGIYADPFARLMRKKEPKQMGPGAGTSRQRRAAKGKNW